MHDASTSICVCVVTDTSPGLMLSRQDFLFLCSYDNFSMEVVVDDLDVVPEPNEVNNMAAIHGLTMQTAQCTGQSYICIAQNLLSLE